MFETIKDVIWAVCFMLAVTAGTLALLALGAWLS